MKEGPERRPVLQVKHWSAVWLARRSCVGSAARVSNRRQKQSLGELRITLGQGGGRTFAEGWALEDQGNSLQSYSCRTYVLHLYDIWHQESPTLNGMS